MESFPLCRGWLRPKIFQITPVRRGMEHGTCQRRWTFLLRIQKCGARQFSFSATMKMTGYYDHVPPFVPPVPDREGTGLVSANIDLRTEYVPLEKDLQRKPAKSARGGPIGLGYRVPLVVASPWSRGGAVCSQVFDHTSILQFLEKFLSHKTGKKIEESNISDWRRAVCGDLTAVFKPYIGEKISLPKSLSRDEFVESIHKAQYKKNPSRLSRFDERRNRSGKPAAPQFGVAQAGTGCKAISCSTYELYADGNLSVDGKSFQILMTAGNGIFARRSAGSPFMYSGIQGTSPIAHMH
jgi:phospholipase C